MNPFLIDIDHPLFNAKVLKQGAQLIHFQPHGKEPVLWSAKIESFKKGKAFRGGIPLCWPWFNKMGTPSHGFARIMEWELVKEDYDDAGVELVFELRDSKETRAIWPYAFHAKVVMKLGLCAEVSLHVKAEIESTAALHSYFTCKDIDDVRVHGLGTLYTDSLQEGKRISQGVDVLSVNNPVDRIYLQPEEKTTLVEDDQHVMISHKNHSDVVIWNPWEEGAKNLADMQDDEYTKMLCIETARINTPLKKEDVLHVKIAV